MSLLFNTLSRFVIAFLLRSNHLLISVTIHSDFGALEEEICHYFHLFTFCLSGSNGTRCHDFSFVGFFFFLIFSFKPALSLSSITLIKRLFSSSSLSAIRVVSFTCLRLFFLSTVLLPACYSSNPAFLLMCSVCRLKKQGDSRQPCCTHFSIVNQSLVPYRVLTVAS